jgi:putative DNA primase/helicase
VSGRDWLVFDAELRARVPDLAVELLGQPTFRTGQEWRWGRKGSLSVVIAGPRAGMWFDHEAGKGGGFVDLVGRDLGMARSDANDWIADRIGMGARHRPAGRRADRAVPRTAAANAPVPPQPRPVADDAPQTRPVGAAPAASRTEDATARAARIWITAGPAPVDHPYLATKRVGPLALRMDTGSRLIVPLHESMARSTASSSSLPTGRSASLPAVRRRATSRWWVRSLCRSPSPPDRS